MTGQVFLSYSRQHDASYVDKLAAYLAEAGVPVWYDKELNTGYQWTQVIQEKIDTCAAFVVVMTPEAYHSEWVAREITQAQDRGRPIYPLLLRGERFFTLANLQYEDVNAGQMPSAGLISQLRSPSPSHTQPAVGTMPNRPQSRPNPERFAIRHTPFGRLGHIGHALMPLGIGVALLIVVMTRPDVWMLWLFIVATLPLAAFMLWGVNGVGQLEITTNRLEAEHQGCKAVLEWTQVASVTVTTHSYDTRQRVSRLVIEPKPPYRPERFGNHDWYDSVDVGANGYIYVAWVEADPNQLGAILRRFAPSAVDIK